MTFRRLDSILNRDDACDDVLAIVGDDRLTYGELRRRVEERACSLQKAGLCRLDVLLLPVEKSFTDVINLLATVALGTPVLLCSNRASEALLSSLSSLATMTYSSDLSDGVTRLKPPFDADRFSTGRRPAIGICSSGSTGDPKQIWHSLESIVASAEASNRLLPLIEDSRSLVSIPLYHVGGLGVLFRALLSKTALVFSEAADEAETYSHFNITRTSLVPTQLHRLLNSNTNALPILQILIGGAPITDSLLSQARNKGWQVHRTYGLSEMASQVITEVTPDHWCCLDHAELKIESQEVFVKGESLFLGYGEPTNLTVPTCSSGWFATSDMASWREAKFRFIGRKDNVFVSGGENVLPEFVEKTLLESRVVDSVVVLPQPNAVWGSQCVALIYPATLAAKNRLKALAKQRLAPHERPKHYYRRVEVEHEAGRSVKVQRKALIEQVARNELEEI